jgi:hypothetical protein
MERAIWKLSSKQLPELPELMKGVTGVESGVEAQVLFSSNAGQSPGAGDSDSL